jgi:hypothetical protein
MSRLPKPGSDNGSWGDILNDFLSQVHNSDGSLKDLPQSKVINLTSDLAAKTNTSSLAAVATSGSYNDLSGKPTIPDISTLVTNAGLDEKAALLILDGESTTRTLLSATFAHTLMIMNLQTTSYTLVLGDCGKLIELNATNSTSLTVPTNASVAFEIGTVIGVRQYGTGQVTITAADGVILRSRGSVFRTAGQYAEASITKRAANEWIVTGDLSA